MCHGEKIPLESTREMAPGMKTETQVPPREMLSKQTPLTHLVLPRLTCNGTLTAHEAFYLLGEAHRLHSIRGFCWPGSPIHLTLTTLPDSEKMSRCDWQCRPRAALLHRGQGFTRRGSCCYEVPRVSLSWGHYSELLSAQPAYPTTFYFYLYSNPNLFLKYTATTLKVSLILKRYSEN